MHSTNPTHLNQAAGIMDAIFLSPHLDDAVLSAGNMISSLVQQGKRVAVVTFFSDIAHIPKTESVRVFLRESGVKNATSLFAKRKNEDVRALAILGVRFFSHEDFPDALFRMNDGSPIYPSFNHVFGGRIHPDDTSLRHHLRHTITVIAAHHVGTHTRIYGPLGVGKHADHILTHEETRHIFGSRVRYWEDVPYRAHPEQTFSRIAYVEKQGLLLHGDDILSSNGFLKQKATLVYKTQTRGLFQNGLADADFFRERIYET